MTLYEKALKDHPIHMRWENFKLVISEYYWRILLIIPSVVTALFRGPRDQD